MINEVARSRPSTRPAKGGNTAVSNEVASYREARKSVEKSRAVRIFLVHLAVFVLGNIFLAFWNSLTYYVKDNELLWFPIPFIFWGIGVLIHYTVSVVLFEEWWERDESQIEARS